MTFRRHYLNGLVYWSARPAARPYCASPSATAPHATGGSCRSLRASTAPSRSTAATHRSTDQLRPLPLRTKGLPHMADHLTVLLAQQLIFLAVNHYQVAEGGE